MQTLSEQSKTLDMATEVELVERLLPYYKGKVAYHEGTVGALWSRLYDRLAPRLYGFFYNHGMKEQAKMQDAVQEVFFILHRRLADLRKPQAFLCWFYRVARTVRCMQFARPEPTDPHHNESLSGCLATDHENPLLTELAVVHMEQALLTKEAQWNVEQILNRLGVRCREILILRHADGLSPEDIAQILGEGTPDLVSVWLHRCKKKAAEIAGQLAGQGLL